MKYFVYADDLYLKQQFRILSLNTKSTFRRNINIKQTTQYDYYVNKTVEVSKV